MWLRGRQEDNLISVSSPSIELDTKIGEERRPGGSRCARIRCAERSKEAEEQSKDGDGVEVKRKENRDAQTLLPH